MLQRAALRVVLGVMLLGPGVWAQQAPPQAERLNGPASALAPRPLSPDVITGTWDYNDSLSVDAATGRPERAPRSAAQRVIGQRVAGSGGAPSGGGSRSGGSGAVGGPEGGGGRDTFDEARRAMAAVIAAERRTYVRDLLEVPEVLKIKASSNEVTIGDDLGRERTYSTDGRLQKYQLSAARYQARASWTDTYFRKDIEGANNFKMTETYFVSEDGSRLFVIIRIGDPRKPETLAGVNRVYDRVGSQ